jgi:hypothetical protein
MIIYTAYEKRQGVVREGTYFCLYDRGRYTSGAQLCSYRYLSL